MCDPTTQITIDKFKGKAVGKELLRAFFLWVPGPEESLSFFAQDGVEKASNLQVGSEFTFHHEHKDWILSIETASCELVTGRWKNGDNWEPDQSYQAQAGVTVPDDENAAAANV